MEEDFYASIKLKTGEEVFARVLPYEESNGFKLIITNPITVSSIIGRSGTNSYRVEPWMKTTTEDMFIIKMEDVITISENKDMEMIMLHDSYVKKIHHQKNNQITFTNKMGYLSNVKDAKKLLEKIYKNS